MDRRDEASTVDTSSDESPGAPFGQHSAGRHMLPAPGLLVRYVQQSRGHLRRLPVRLLLFVLAPLVALTVAVGTYVLASLETQLELRLQREVEMVARALRLPLGAALSSGGKDAVMPALDSAFAIRRVYGAFVYDEKGELVAASAPWKPAGEPVGVGDVLAEGQRTGRYDEIDGREVYSYFVPLDGPGAEMIGVLRVTKKKSDLISYLDQLRTRGLILVGIAAATLTGIVLLGYHAAIGRSLHRFASSIDRVGRGERTHRAHPGGPQEITSLAAMFNDMLDSLARTEHRANVESQRRQTAETKMRHSERLAAIGRVVAGVAHELGTPLSIVAGYAQRLMRKEDLEPASKEAMLAIRSQTARMESLVRQLLDYGARAELNRSHCRTLDIVHAAADALGPVLEEHASVTLRFDEDRDALVFVDRGRVEQALINLVRNAIQAANSQVVVSVDAAGSNVSFNVDDDGPGISPQMRARLYEPFSTTRQARGGTGLGLAICWTVAQEHDGRLYDTRSELGGARFVLVLAAGPDKEVVQ